MAEDNSNPFTDEHRTQVHDALRKIDDAEKLLQRAKVAGIDVADYDAQVKQSKQRLRKIQQAFFPNS